MSLPNESITTTENSGNVESCTEEKSRNDDILEKLKPVTPDHSHTLHRAMLMSVWRVPGPVAGAVMVSGA